MTLRSGSLFTGTAALDMAAAEIFGAQPAWCADLDPGAVALLAHHYPDLPNLGDITKVDWDLVAKLAWVYVLTLGWPCQPWSLAGKRKGADDERALWPECERAIRALRPRYLLLENVPAVVAAGELERVATSLATIGYRFAWCCLPASAVGAPHRRERFFLAAVAEDADGAAGGERRLAAPGEAEGGRARADVGGRGRAPAADTEEQRRYAGRLPVGAGQAVTDLGDAGEADANAARDGRQQGRTESAGFEGRLDVAERRGALTDADSDSDAVREQPVPLAGRRSPAVAEQLGADAAPDAYRDERERQPVQQPGEAAAAGDRGRPDWAGYAPAIHRWEAIVGRPAPVPTVPGVRGGRVLNPALPEWMMGLPEGWITAVPGLSRAAQLKLAGNGVVKQQAVAAYRYLLDVLERDANGQREAV